MTRFVQENGYLSQYEDNYRLHPVKVKFVKSAVWPEDYPESGLCEVAFVGRSNAGKSSLINAILNCRVAKVSGEPGKTRLINFFEVRKKYHLVDLPGYGFAKVSRDEREKWRQMIETYTSLRSSLVGLVLVMDIRRDWAHEEAQLVAWVKRMGKKGLVVLNKADKVKTSDLVKSQKNVGKLVDWPIVVCSSFKKTGVVALEEQIWQWVQENL